MTWWVVRSKGGKLVPFQVRMGSILPGLPNTGEDLDGCLSRVTGMPRRRPASRLDVACLVSQ